VCMYVPDRQDYVHNMYLIREIQFIVQKMTQNNSTMSTLYMLNVTKRTKHDQSLLSSSSSFYSLSGQAVIHKFAFLSNCYGPCRCQPTTNRILHQTSGTVSGRIHDGNIMISGRIHGGKIMISSSGRICEHKILMTIKIS